MMRVMPSLLERQAELETLSTAVERAGTGRGSAVLVLGEAGIGKTSLVRAFLSAAAGRGAGAGRRLRGPAHAARARPAARRGPVGRGRPAGRGAVPAAPIRISCSPPSATSWPRLRRPPCSWSRTSTGRTARRSTCCATSVPGCSDLPGRAAADLPRRRPGPRPSAARRARRARQHGGQPAAAGPAHRRTRSASWPRTTTSIRPSCSGSPAATRSSSPRCSPTRATRAADGRRRGAGPGAHAEPAGAGGAGPAGGRAVRRRDRPAARPGRRPGAGRRGRAGRRAGGARRRGGLPARARPPRRRRVAAGQRPARAERGRAAWSCSPARTAIRSGSCTTRSRPATTTPSSRTARRRRGRPSRSARTGRRRPATRRSSRAGTGCRPPGGPRWARPTRGRCATATSCTPRWRRPRPPPSCGSRSATTPGSSAPWSRCPASSG